jgi:hypothetical protein
MIKINHEHKKIENIWTINKILKIVNNHYILSITYTFDFNNNR